MSSPRGGPESEPRGHSHLRAGFGPALKRQRRQLGQWLRWLSSASLRPGGVWRCLGWGLMLGTSCWSVLPLPDWHGAPIPWFPLQFSIAIWSGGSLDKLAHLLIAGGAGTFMAFAAAASGATEGAVRKRVFGVVMVWTGLLELTQALLPYRRSELADWLAGALGVALSLAVRAWWIRAWARARWDK